MGLLSIVGTPIGNLGDITLRALETLKKSDVIACEDTRVTAKLLARYEIKKPLLIFHQRSGKGAADRVLSALEEGKHVALVTDAGTPGISDPGNELVALVRSELPDVKIEAIPGPSALAAALSVAGMHAEEFVFLGFLPHKKGRQKLLDEVAEMDRTVVLYESPHRIGKLLEEVARRTPERKMAVIRELTKMFEASDSGTALEMKEKFEKGDIQAKGEFVVVLA